MDVDIRGFLAVVGCLTSLVFAQEMIINPSGDQHVVAVEESRVFVCEVINAQNQDAYLKWFNNFNQEILETNGRVYIERKNSVMLKLYFTRIIEQDSGYYTCDGQVQGNHEQMGFELSIFKDITFDYAPSPQNPVQFTNALIMCRVSGNPAPEVSWRYRGQAINSGGRYLIDPNEGLYINNITEADNGLYECRAEVRDTGTFKSRQITVVIHIAPRITRELGTTVGVEHQQVAMECKGEGLPDPYYEFYRINEDDSTSRLSSTETRFVDEAAGVVHYTPLTRDDQAEYECHAKNGAGTAVTRGFLDVIIPPKIYQYFNKTEIAGGHVTLQCLSEGEPSPSMTFRKVGNDHDYVNGENENGHVIVVHPESGKLELTIQTLYPNDTSNYTCNSLNEGGFAEQNGTIIVQHAPYFPEQATDAYGWPGKTVNLTCKTVSEPEPVFRWWKDNKELENNETFRIIPLIKNCVLQIYMREEDKSWIYDQYECAAKNQHGQDSLFFYFHEAGEPGPPAGARVVEDSPTTVIVEVDPPVDTGGLPLIGYRVEFESTHADYGINQVIFIENLRPATTYQFNVRARNEVDVGPPYRMTHTMPEISAPHKIKIISDPEGLYPYDYTILWEKPLTGGIPIKEYRFRYRRVIVADGSYDVIEVVDDWLIRHKEDNPDVPMSSYKLEGLKQRTFYQVEVMARNDIGWSEESDQFVFSTSEDPSRPIYGIGCMIKPHYTLLYCFVYLLSMLL